MSHSGFTLTLPLMDCLRLAAVLEDCTTHLDILGRVITVPTKKECSGDPEQDAEENTKLTKHCQHLCEQVSRFQEDLEQRQTFSSLLQLLKDQDKIDQQSREGELAHRTQRRYDELQQDTAQKQQDLNQRLIQLEDQLERVKADLEKKMKTAQKHADLQLQQTQKQNAGIEWLLEDQTQQLEKKLQLEVRVHEESKNWLDNQHLQLQQQFEWWNLHSEQTSQDKQQQMDDLRREQTQDTERLTELKWKYREMEQVVISYREEKEKLHRQLERQQKEDTAVTMVQAWWRGCMVRRGLGPFKKGTKSKEVKTKGKKAKGKK